MVAAGSMPCPVQTGMEQRVARRQSDRLVAERGDRDRFREHLFVGKGMGEQKAGADTPMDIELQALPHVKAPVLKLLSHDAVSAEPIASALEDLTQPTDIAPSHQYIDIPPWTRLGAGVAPIGERGPLE